MNNEEQNAAPSRVGLWNKFYANCVRRAVYDDPYTAKEAGRFLRGKGIKVIEDWGCGYGGFKTYIGFFQKYIGIDGSQTRYADKIVDLEKYTSAVDAIHMRHVLEHNPRWELILMNALRSFQKRMVLTLFTPYSETTHVLKEYPNFNNTGITMIDISFRRSDITQHFTSLKWTPVDNLKTKTDYKVEHMFLLEK